MTISGLAYMQFHAESGWFEDNYIRFLDTFACTEAFFLLLGAPWGGIFQRIRGLRRAFSDSLSNRRRRLAFQRSYKTHTEAP